MEIVQAGFDAYVRGDLPVLLERFASDAVVTSRPDQPDVRDFHGHDGVMDALTEWVSTWDGFSVEILRVRDAGDVVIVMAQQRGQGARSGVPMDDAVTYAFTLKGAKIVRWQCSGPSRRPSEPSAWRSSRDRITVCDTATNVDRAQGPPPHTWSPKLLDRKAAHDHLEATPSGLEPPG